MGNPYNVPSMIFFIITAVAVVFVILSFVKRWRGLQKIIAFVMLAIGIIGFIVSNNAAEEYQKAAILDAFYGGEETPISEYADITSEDIRQTLLEVGLDDSVVSTVDFLTFSDPPNALVFFGEPLVVFEDDPQFSEYIKTGQELSKVATDAIKSKYGNDIRVSSYLFSALAYEDGEYVETENTENVKPPVASAGETANESTDAALEPESQNPSTGTVNSDDVNLRAEPSTDSEIITKVSKPLAVEIIEQSGDWYKVRTDGQEGYIHSDYLD